MPANLPRARELFLHAVGKLPPDQWDGYVAAASGGDVELQHQALGLLRLHREAGSFLVSPAISADITPKIDQTPERSGMQIGPYKLLQQIGEGGMGVVYMAEQLEPVKRRVALKIIKPGMDSEQVIARFDAERQALALMDHVNIARVIDGGTTQAGRPYFVMELVHGVPITQYCDDQRLTPRQRLALFVPVCQAIQHAHQKGVIHRDIKPSNVMVTLCDGQPVPKVIDFGVAKATEQKLTEQTLFTHYGAMVGTLEYMSPEQAEMSALGVDTRSDIYSLGVLLYELLTGSTPLSRKRLKETAFSELLRLIKEEEPPKPSSRLSDSGEALASISANRHTEPAKLTKLVRGELDWIVMKCLEKDRNRRYETANGLAKDVQRHLADEAVLACPPSAGYRLRKFVQRNKGPALAGTLVMVALVGGVIGTTWGMIRAEQARRNALAAQLAEAERAKGERRAREEAQKRLAQIEKGTEILASVFQGVDPTAEIQEGVTLRVLLGRRLGEAAQQLEGEAVGNPLVVARLQHLLGISLRELGHLKQAEVVLVKASQTREHLLGADHLDTVTTNHHLAKLYRDQGKYAQAEALFQKVLAVRTAKLGADHPDTLTTKHYLAIVYGNQKKFALAEKTHKEVLATRTARLGADHPDTLVSKRRLGWVYLSEDVKKYDLAEDLYREVLEISAAKLGEDHLDTLATKANLAALYLAQGKYALAEPLFQDVLAVRTAKLGTDHPDTLTSRHQLASLYQGQGNFALAEALYKEVLTARIARLGPDHAQTISGQHTLAKLYCAAGRFADAIPLLEDLYRKSSAQREFVQVGSPFVDDLAAAYLAMKLSEKAVPLYEDALLKRTEQFGRDDSRTLGALGYLAEAYRDNGRHADAVALFEELIRLRTAKEGTSDNILVAGHKLGLADALLCQKKYAEAEPLLREGLGVREKLQPGTWLVAAAQSSLGEALAGQQKYAEAEPLLLAAYEGLQRSAATIPVRYRNWPTLVLERLVHCYEAWEKPDEAARWRKELEKTKETP